MIENRRVELNTQMRGAVPPLLLRIRSRLILIDFSVDCGTKEDSS